MTGMQMLLGFFIIILLWALHTVSSGFAVGLINSGHQDRHLSVCERGTTRILFGGRHLSVCEMGMSHVDNSYANNTNK